MSEPIFGKYRLQGRLAVGGMGEVFSAVQLSVPGFERQVILKSLLSELAADPAFVAQFLDEARVAARLSHPNVVSIYEVGLWQGTYYIVMEFIDGVDLARLLRRMGGPLPPVVAARIISDAALGLFHAHTAKSADDQPLRIVHRDVSPQNVMVRYDGVTKVVDFGIASATVRQTRTATGLLKGKFAYMAPEQVMGQPATPLSDQFALGVCLWELLTGSRLFRPTDGDAADLAVLKRVLEARILAPLDTEPALSAIVLRMLDRSPAQRYPDCLTVANELGTWQLSRAGPTVAQFMRALPPDVATPSLPSANFVESLGRHTRVLDDAGEAEVLGTRDLLLEPSIATASLAASPLTATTPRAGRWRPVVLVASSLVVASVAAWRWARPLASVPTSVDAGQLLPAALAPPATLEAPPEPAAAPAAVAVSVTTTPSGAQVRVDGRQVVGAPVTLFLTPATHHFYAELAGHQPAEVESEATDVALHLTKLANKSSEPPKGPVTVTIGSEPWARVYLDGVEIGLTPLKLDVRRGRHQLRFVNPEEGIDTTRSVNVTPASSTLRFELK